MSPEASSAMVAGMMLPEIRPRQPFTGLALSAALGIALADAWPIGIWWAAALALTAGALTLWRPGTLACLCFTMLAFFALHEVRFHGSGERALGRELEAGPQVAEASGIVWNEPQKPASFSRYVTCRFQLKLETFSMSGRTAPPGMMVNVNWAGKIPTYGDRVAVLASAQNLEPQRNPGPFDFTKHQQRQGIYSELDARFAEDCRILESGHGSSLQVFANKARQWIRGRLELDLADAPEITSLIESMVLGLRGDAMEDAKELFQRTGTLHLFAVSGLHVAMLAGILLALLRPLRVTGSWAIWLVIPILAFYAVVTGLRPSCIRASIMLALILLAPVFDRRAVTFNSLAGAAFLLLAWDTNQLFSPGFQFSFVLVFTIVVLSRRIQGWLEPLALPDEFLPRSLWSWPQSLRATGGGLLAAALGLTLSAWLGSLLFTAGYFHLFSPAAILANLLVVPVAFGMLALSVATLITGSVWPALAIIFNNANWAAAKLLLALVHLFAVLPGGHVYVEVPSLKSAPVAEFTVYDLRTGGATHLRSGACDWLLDCGHEFDYDRTLLPSLRSRGINQLDGLLLTHGDVRHIGATLSVLADFHPRIIADSVLRDHSSTRAKIMAELSARQIGKRLCNVGDRLSISEAATLRVLFPPAGLKRSSADDKALVVQLEAGGTRALFMSDSGFATEQWLLENEPDLRSDILVKGQHAKDISGTADFISRVQPQVVICSGLDVTQAVEPLDAWAAEISALGVAVFRQDCTGAVQVQLRRGGAYEVRAFLGGQTFRRRAR